MQLIIDKPIKGIINRGEPDEVIVHHASPGDKLDVVFNNTEDKEGKTIGHYICVPRKERLENIIEDGLQFIVFPSQVFAVIESKKNAQGEHNTNKVDNDPFSTLLSEDDNQSLL